MLLDLDGTVLDTHDLILASWAHLKALFALEADDERFRQGIGTPLETLLAPWATADRTAEQLAEAYRAHNDTIHDAAVKPFPGMPALFRDLRAAGIPIAIVTSKSKAFAERGLRVTGLQADLVVGPKDAPHPKPAPDPVWFALDRLGVARQRAIFVGDAATDLRSGRAAGVITGAALWGPFPRAELEREAPDHWFDAPAAVGTFVLGEGGSYSSRRSVRTTER